MSCDLYHVLRGTFLAGISSLLGGSMAVHFYLVGDVCILTIPGRRPIGRQRRFPPSVTGFASWFAENPIVIYYCLPVGTRGLSVIRRSEYLPSVYNN